MCAAQVISADGSQEANVHLLKNNISPVGHGSTEDSAQQIVNFSAAENDREWLFLNLNSVTKYKFFRLISDQSIASLRSVTKQINIIMPEDMDFSRMDVKLCKMRWLMKVCVLISLTLVNLQMFEFTIVSHTIISYYDTTIDMVNWTSLIYMLSYVIFTFPVSYLLDNRILNLRLAMIICGSLTLSGCLVKFISVDLMSFSVAFIGQILVALAQVIILNIPTQLAFEWFAAQEKTLICNLSIFGMQLGMLLGFAITPWLVNNHDTAAEIGTDLHRLNYLHCGFALFQLILVVCVFQAQPKNPPCYLQAIQEKSRCSKQFFWKTFKILIRSCDFNLLNLSYGLQMGVITSIFTLINPMILRYLPEAENDAGLIGVTIIGASLFSSLIMIIILRHQRHLKYMALFAAGMTATSVITFVIGLLTGSEVILYLAALSIGFFATAFQTIGYEFAFELTFPESDGTVSGILNVSAQMCGIITTTLVTTAYSSAGHLTGNLLLIAFLLLSICCLTFANCTLNRFNAFQIIDTTAKHLGKIGSAHEKTPLLATPQTSQQHV